MFESLENRAITSSPPEKSPGPLADRTGTPYRNRASLRQASMSKAFDIQRVPESERTPLRNLQSFVLLSVSFQGFTDPRFV